MKIYGLKVLSFGENLDTIITCTTLFIDLNSVVDMKNCRYHIFGKIHHVFPIRHNKKPINLLLTGMK